MLRLSILAGLLASAPLLPAADITWRGGFGNSFHERQNWNLPPGASNENERRVPGLGDRAIIAEGIPAVTVTAIASVGVVRLNAGSLTILDGGNLSIGQQINEPSQFNGPVTVKGGGLTCIRSVSFGAAAPLTVEGGLASFFSTATVREVLVTGGQLKFDQNMTLTEAFEVKGGRASFSRPAIFEGPVTLTAGSIFEVPVFLDGSDAFGGDFRGGLWIRPIDFPGTATTITVDGRLLVSSEVQWLGGNVSGGAWIFRKTGGGAILELVGSGGVFSWESRQTLEFGSGSTLLRGVGFGVSTFQFHGPVRFTGGDGIKSLDDQFSVSRVQFLDSVKAEAGVSFDGPIELIDACQFEVNAPGVSINPPTPPESSATGYFDVDDHSVLLVRHNLDACFLSVKKRGELRFQPLVSGGRVSLRIHPSGMAGFPVTPPSLRVVGGTIDERNGTGEIVIGKSAILAFIPPEPEPPPDEDFLPPRTDPPPNLVRCDIRNLGTIIFEGLPHDSPPPVRAIGTWFNDPDGAIRFTARAGTVDALTLINYGLVSVAERTAEGQEPSATGGTSRLCSVFLNEGAGILKVERGCTAEIGGGHNLAAIELSPFSFLQIADCFVNQATFTGLDGTFVTRQFDGLFVIRDGSLVNTAAEKAGIKLVGAGRIGAGVVNAGLRTEIPLEVSRLVMGGALNHEPRFEGIGSFAGPILTIKEELTWHGGRFIGNSPINQPGTQTIEMGASTQLSVNDLESAGGATISLGGGMTFNFRGKAVIDTGRPINFLTGSAFINHPEGVIEMKRVVPVGGIVGRFRNEGIVRKTTLSETVLRGGFEQAGEFRVEEGMVTSSDVANMFTRPVELAQANATFNSTAGTYRDMNFTGPGLLKIGGAGGGNTMFEGTVNVDNLQIGNAGDRFPALRSAANTKVNIVKSLSWQGNDIQMGANSELNILSGANADFRNNNPDGFFMFFNAGTIKNEGTVTYVADSVPIVGQQGAVFHNRPGGTFMVTGAGPVWQARQLNPVMISSMTFLNEGAVAFDVKAGQGRQIPWHPVTEQRAGEFQAVSMPAAALQAPPVPRLAQAGQNRIVFAERMTLTGGGMHVQSMELEFAKLVLVEGGQLFMESPSRVVMKDACFVQLPGGTVTVGEDSLLVVEKGITLQDLGRLKGGGEVKGNVRCPSGVIAPGNGRPIDFLHVLGDVEMGSRAKFLVDVPIDVERPAADTLGVSGKFTAGGELVVSQIGAENKILSTAFIELVIFDSFTGDFNKVSGTILPGGATLVPGMFGDPPGLFGLRAIANVAQADLALFGPDQPNLNTATTLEGGDVRVIYAPRNFGPREAIGAKLEVTHPTDFVFKSSTPPGTLEGNKVTIPLGDLAADAQREVTVNYTVPPRTGAFDLLAALTSQTSDPVPGNNSLTTRVGVLPKEGIRILDFQVGSDGVIRLRMDTISGVRYRIERSTDLINWTVVVSFVGDGSSKDVTPPRDAGESAFFRAVVL